MTPPHSVPHDAADAGAKPIVSIRWVVSIATVVLTSLVVASVGIVGEGNTRRVLTEELVRRLCAQAYTLALVSSSAFLTPYPELTLHPVLVKTRERAPELTIATVCDRSGAILGDADPRRLERPFQAPEGLVKRRPDPAFPGVSVSMSRAMLLASAPIVHPNGTLLGMAHVALRRSYVDDAIRSARQPVLLMFASLLAAGMIGSFLLTSTLLRPIGILRAGLERIGRGDLDTRLVLSARTEFGRLAQTVNRMTADLKRAQSQVIERERLAHEIHLAQRIQRSLLPKENLVEGGFIVAGVQRPAAEVGGDFYDVFRLPDGRIGFAVADVAGKGLGGCLVTSMVAALLVAQRDACGTPADLLVALDRSLSQRLDRGVFVTMFVGYLDPEKNELTYASAGHHPGLLVHADGRYEWLEAAGLPIGVDRVRGLGHSLAEATVTLAPGDLVVQTTDGIHETEGGPTHEAFGLERVAATVGGSAAQGGRHVIDALSQAVEVWRGHDVPADDETIVVLSWEGARPGAGGDPFAAPIERVAEARARGRALKLPLSLEALVRLEDWVSRLPELSGRSISERARVVLILHELCANIIEHGHGGVAGVPFLIWWVPSPAGAASSDASADGHFVILDQAVPFSADNATTPDYLDPEVRSRGRGFGIDLVRRAAGRLVYHPATSLGNITLVSLGKPETSSLHGEAA